ncbi:MAG: Ig-like domain-containing protein [Gemmatimonadales bacterium]|nr:Ig-like domain-containing protein [Gemmatimonadales bacterium]
MVVSPDSLRLEVGSSAPLQAVVRDTSGNPLNGRAVTWRSDDPAVVSVSMSGVVTAVSGGGPVQVTATSESQFGVARVWVHYPQSGTVGQKGGALSTASGAGVIVLSPGAVAGEVKVQLRDSQPETPRYAPLSASGVHLRLPLTGQGADYRAGTAKLTFALSRMPQPGAVVYVRAKFKGVADKFWAKANVVSDSRAEIAIPTEQLTDFTTLLGLDTLDVTFNVEEFVPSEAMSSLQSARTGSMPSATSEPGCPQLPAGLTLSNYYVACTGGVLRLIEPGKSGPSSKIGIVLVHGWLPSIGNGEDYLKEQGLLCENPASVSSTPATLISVVCSAPPAPDPNAALPVTNYFKHLLTALRADQASALRGAPIYGFDYQSYRDHFTSGAQLMDALRDTMDRNGLQGFVIVAHSMGGLIAREAARRLEDTSKAAQVILGVITLGTPHLGTPLVGMRIANFFSGVATPARTSLITGAARDERATLIAYGGHKTSQGQYLFTGTVLCLSSGLCRNDGVVPLGSALPSTFVGSGRVELLTPYEPCDHTELKEARCPSIANDDLYVTLRLLIGHLLRRAGAENLNFRVPPANTVARSRLGSVEIRVLDAIGTPIETGATFEVNLRLDANPTSATLGGTTTATAHNGVAVFDDLTIDKPGTGYTLAASLAGIADLVVTSRAFNVTAAPEGQGQFMVPISAGNHHTCAITISGHSYCWGWGSSGRLGNGSTMNRLTPTLVSGNYAFTMLSTMAGSFAATCAITTAGTAHCWGGSNSYQLGNGSLAESLVPTPVAGGFTFSQVSSGFHHACGITNNGEAYCWGGNAFGEIGSGSLSSARTPVRVISDVPFSSISAGAYHTCGISTSGVGYCWGEGFLLGTGTTTRSYVPVPIAGAHIFATISAAYNHSCALTTEGVSLCWGSRGNYGYLGDNSPDLSALMPVPTAGGHRWVAISARQWHTCGINTSGAAYCWGAGGAGRLGNGSSITRRVPTPVAGDLVFTSISAGIDHTCGITDIGDAYCWGGGSLGALGSGSTVSSDVPIQVTGGLRFPAALPALRFSATATGPQDRRPVR